MWMSALRPRLMFVLEMGHNRKERAHPPFLFFIENSMLNASTSPERRSGPAAPSKKNMNNATLSVSLEGELLAPAAAAKYLSLSRQSIYRLIERGLLPVYKFCRHLRIRRKDLESLVARSRETVGLTRYEHTED